MEEYAKGTIGSLLKENYDHRLTLRLPKWLLNKIDEKRKQRIGTISRNLWILEILEKEISNKNPVQEKKSTHDGNLKNLILNLL